MPGKGRPFEKGNKAGGGAVSQLRRDMTVRLIEKLNQIITQPKSKEKMLAMDAIVEALIWNAIEGDMTAIKEIFDRLEGKPAQRITGPNDSAMQVELKTREQVMTFLIERGVDVSRLDTLPDVRDIYNRIAGPKLIEG
jgi:hypothetical protein